MTPTRAVLGTVLLIGLGAGVVAENGWLILGSFLAIVALLLTADWTDRRRGPRGTSLPSWNREN